MIHIFDLETNVKMAFVICDVGVDNNSCKHQHGNTMTLFCCLLVFNFQPLENKIFIFNIKVIINTIQGQRKIEKNPKTRIHEDDEDKRIITFLICYQEIKLQFLSFVYMSVFFST